MRIICLTLLFCSAFVTKSVQACSPTAITVTLAKGNALISGAFDQTAVASHMQYFQDLNSTDYRKDDATSFGCVDARSDDPQIGTPGGDLAEFAGGVAVYYSLTGKTPDIAGVRSLFQSFVSKYVNSSRPFYFHTDDTRLGYAFTNISAAVGRNVTVLPPNGPPASEQTTWLNELTASYAQGCGHLRLMISNFSSYGLTSDFVPKAAIQVFYEEMWKASIADKAKYNFVVKLGSLAGKAIGIISNGGPSCSGYSPAVKPNFGGSSIFIYHATAVDTFRKSILAPFFLSQQGSNFTSADFYNAVSALQNTQLSATLTLLSPANAVSLFSVTVNTTGSPITTSNTATKAAMSALPAVFHMVGSVLTLMMAKLLLI